MIRRRATFAAAALLVVLAGSWLLLPVPASTPSETGAAREATVTAMGTPTCPLSTLPKEAADTVAAIGSDGPFPYPRNDGVVFGNREAHLPAEALGYYHEYTVITPGAANRATRRIITGGTPLTNPPEFYYTADHYDTFCLISGIRARS